MVMQYDLHRLDTRARPLVGDVEAMDRSRNAPGSQERDEAIIQVLREKLKGRPQSNRPATLSDNPAREETRDEDKYEPQRLSRKICWQYDSSAHKVPLLRRYYI